MILRCKARCGGFKQDYKPLVEIVSRLTHKYIYIYSVYVHVNINQLQAHLASFEVRCVQVHLRRGQREVWYGWLRKRHG